MSDPDAPQSSDSEKASARKLVLGVLFIVAGVALYLASRGGDDGNGAGGGNGESEARLELTRTALAATENLEMSEADGPWTELFEQSPQDESIALNCAINRVLRVDQLSSQATNASLGDDEKQAARRQLPEGISGAKQAIDAYAAVADDAVMPMWLRTRIDLHEASLLPGSMTKSIRKEVYQRLSDAINGEIGKDPSAIILGGTLIQVIEQMEDPIDGLPDDLLADAAKTVGVLSDQHADNLFFALRAARFNIDTKNERAADFVERANGLARAIEPSLRRETRPIGVTPDELVAQITSAVGSGDWPEAETRMLLWFNVLNSTEIVKTDRRRATPHPLDRLSFDSLRRLSADVAADAPVPTGESKLALERHSIGESSATTAITAIDFDLDLDTDLVSVDQSGLVKVWACDGGDNWSEAGRLQLEIRPTQLITADLFVVDSSDPQRIRANRTQTDVDQPDFASSVRHDTFLSLIAIGPQGAAVIQIDGRPSATADSRLQLVPGATGLEDIAGISAAVAGDLEADGDLDLVFATESDGVRMFANRGNRTFFEVEPGSGDFSADDPVSAMAIADLDRDLDLDIVTTHAGSGRVGILENLLHLQFRGRMLDEIPAVKAASSIAVEDVDGNVSWDLIVGGSAGTSVVFSQTAAAGAWTIDRVVESSQPAENLVVADLDNDSWLDLVALGPSESKRCAVGPWGLGTDGTWNTMGATLAGDSPLAADFDRDGRIDLAARVDGEVHVFLNRVDSPGHHVDVRFRGIDDNASGRVNHFAIGSVLEIRFGPHYRARIVNSPSTHFGIDGFDSADTIRAILPNGLTQTIRDPKIDSLVEEEQTLKGSCPYLYAWDGEKFVFKTDCLWAAPLGLQVARGVVAKDRPWEYLKIDGDDIQPHGDRYEFRITEELWEVAYFDKVALSVVDHPADVDIWTNEKVGPAEIATPTVFAFSQDNLRTLNSAVDTRGKDVTDQLANADREFVQGFQQRFRQGLCPPHWIDLDFTGQLKPSDAAGANKYLVLTGWILPTDTSLNIQIDQNPQLGPIEFPSIWVPDSTQDGGWRKAIPFMGFPGGKTKTIIVDVTDVIDPQDPRLRVRTSAQIYWDSAAIAVASDPAEHVVQEVELLSAEVAFHGFSHRIRNGSTRPETYDYQDPTSSARWPPLRGRLTQFGDCTELVRRWDDAMVVISCGDEIRLEFSLPEADLPEGWKRDFVLHSVGWDKDADLNTLSGQSTGPLPYREMTQYPPSPGDFARSNRLDELNRPHLQRFQAFRSFWYRNESDRPTRFLDASSTVQ